MKVREATKDDIPAIAKVTVDTWKSAYRGLIDPDYLDNLSYASKEASWQEFAFGSAFVYAAEDEAGNIIGFAAAGPSRETDPVFHGELYAFYIYENYQRSGIGTALFNAVQQHFKDSGTRSMVVWVLSGSPYRRFYEKHGGMLLETIPLEMDGLTNNITAYGWMEL
ncbi:MAG: GNAT family N-acetyltransferase [Syntrophomonadaceae bacterium]|nr:GNAT family N-acetyltransferase [Syntrophomonadaceae bacterium]